MSGLPSEVPNRKGLPTCARLLIHRIQMSKRRADQYSVLRLDDLVDRNPFSAVAENLRAVTQGFCYPARRVWLLRDDESCCHVDLLLEQSCDFLGLIPSLQEADDSLKVVIHRDVSIKGFRPNLIPGPNIEFRGHMRLTKTI